MAKTDFIRSNPFFQLGATPRDDRRRLNALADEALLFGVNEPEAALHTLLHPVQRLDAELAWFPEADPEEIRRLDAYLAQTEPAPFPEINMASPLALFNACRCLLQNWPVASTAQGEALCESLARVDAAMDARSVRLSVNRDREAAGFALIEDGQEFEYRLESFRLRAAQQLLRRLRALPKNAFIEVVDHAAALYGMDGPCQGSQLMEMLVSGYELEMGDSIAKRLKDLQWEVQAITPLVKIYTIKPDGAPAGKVIGAFREWCRITRPCRRMQEVKLLSGPSGEQIFGLLRDAVIRFQNGQKDSASAKAVCTEMAAFFEKHPNRRFMEIIHQDLTTIEKGLKQQKWLYSLTEQARNGNNANAWRRPHGL